MSKLKEQYETWLAMSKKNGSKLTAYLCPHCQGEISALTPPEGEVWDTTVVCYHCEELHFRVIKFNGIEVKKM
jgi:C4-type Zn-finger protein